MRASTDSAYPIPEDVGWTHDDLEEDNTCTACGGSGCDSMESFMPCEECDGEGYRWWE